MSKAIELLEKTRDQYCEEAQNVHSLMLSYEDRVKEYRERSKILDEKISAYNYAIDEITQLKKGK